MAGYTREDAAPVADLSALREGLAANLGAIEDLQVSPYFISNPTFPSAFVRAGPTDYDKTFDRGLDNIVLFVRVLVAAFGDIGPGANLDEYLAGSGPRSIKAAIEDDPSLGGACDDLRVTGNEGEREFTFDDRPSALGAEWRVEVFANG
jgi:hypothetical protein